VDKQNLAILYRKFLDGECQPEEIQQLWNLFGDNGYQHTLRELIEDELSKEPSHEWEKAPENQAVFNRVEHNLISKIEVSQNKILPLHRKWYWRAGMAASLAAMIGFGWYYFGISERELGYTEEKHQLPNDAEPGISKAILTLADGSTINLKGNTNREIATQSNVTISETIDGSLIYKDNTSQQSLAQQNTISTPNGGEYKLTLSDGTKIWLNAASSLQYPTSFTTGERKVILKGEAYFEVAKGTKPFIVSGNEQSVRVLGTHFNIKSYEGERPVTTLLEGSVKVIPNSNAVPKLLSPGQQAVLGQNLTVSNVDTEQDVSWKNGLFSFDHNSLKDALKQMERWYNVEVDYSNVPDIELVGTIPRSARLSSVLKALEVTSNVKFKIEERRISIMK
jgi:transmembrane sensor